MPSILPGPAYTPAFEKWWETQAPDYNGFPGILANTFKGIAFRGWTASTPIDQDTARQAIYAFFDLLDGQQDYELQDATGLPPARCAEIINLWSHLYTKYGADWLKTFA